LLGIRDEAVLRAMRAVPREDFVSERMREFAYRNAPLPIGMGQTISQPLVVASMAEVLELSPADKVFEIGCGSGYAAAVLSRIAKAVVWSHNAHLGDPSATEFGKHGQLNLGQLCRETFGEDVYVIGQGTDRGAVAAASHWEAEMEIKQFRPSRPDSFERLMHLAEIDAFFFPLSKSSNPQLTAALTARRLERAIGAMYRPKTER